MSRREATWDGAEPGRERVLLECPSHHSPGIIAGAVEQMGYEVRVCEGPTTSPCRLVARGEGSCPLVTGADVVVNMLGTRSEDARQVVEHILGERRPPALVVEATSMEEQQLAADRDKVIVVPTPMRGTTLSGALAEALRPTTPES